MRFRRSPVREIHPHEAAAELAAGALELVDVREHAELAEARVPGARHIPLAELGARLHELGRARPVAFLCRSGGRSAMATRMAVDSGCDASNVRGGISAWARAGLPLAAKETA